MSAESTEPLYPFALEGQRLRAFVDERWSRRDGGITKLAADAGTTTETLYAWFRGDNLPSYASLRAIARALRVRPIEIVAAIEADEIPEQKEAPRPQWAEGLATKDDIDAMIQTVIRLTARQVIAGEREAGQLPLDAPALDSEDSRQ